MLTEILLHLSHVYASHTNGARQEYRDFKKKGEGGTAAKMQIEERPTIYLVL